MAEGNLELLRANEDVVAASRVREFELKVQELEELRGSKTVDVEISHEALYASRGKTPALRLKSPPPGGSR